MRLPVVTAEAVVECAETPGGPALVLLPSGGVVVDVPLPTYDGPVVADHATVWRLLVEYGEDVQRVADVLTGAARQLCGQLAGQAAA